MIVSQPHLVAMTCHKRESGEGHVDAATGESVGAILARHGRTRTELIEILHDIQRELRYLPQGALCAVADRLGIPLIEVFRVASFYNAFSLVPRGRHVLTLCTGTACHVRGSPKLLDQARGELGIGPGGTTPDGKLSLETVNCVGACALGPVAILDGEYHHHVTPARLRALIAAVVSGHPAKAAVR